MTKKQKTIIDFIKTAYADKIGFYDPKVWYSKKDGWWLETQKEEVYLGADSAGAKKKLTLLCEGVYAIKEIK